MRYVHCYTNWPIRSNNYIQGSKQQVVIAGAIAGLVSRYAPCTFPHHAVFLDCDIQILHRSPRRHQNPAPAPSQLHGRPTILGPNHHHPTQIPRRPINLQNDPPRRRHHSPPLSHSLDTSPACTTRADCSPQQGLWKGNIPAEALYILYGGIQFSTYRQTTALLHTLPTPNHQPLSSTVESFIAGALAGALATTATYPLDLLRTRFAAQGPDRVYASLLHSIRDIARTEGPRGFFQGLGAGVGQVVPYMGLFFAAYEALRPALAGLELPFGSGHASAGVLASVAAKTGVFPLDLVRKRLQVQGPTRERYASGNTPASRGVGRTMRAIVRREGVRGLYRGLTVSLVKAAPASAVTMWTYERALRFFKETENDRVVRA